MTCPNCGTALPTQAASCPTCGITLSNGLCAHCGVELAKAARFCHACGPAAVKSSPVAATAAALTATPNRQASTIAPAQETTLLPLEGHRAQVLAVAVTPDGSGAVSGSFDGTLRLWDLASGETL